MKCSCHSLILATIAQALEPSIVVEVTDPVRQLEGVRVGGVGDEGLLKELDKGDKFIGATRFPPALVSAVVCVVQSDVPASDGTRLSGPASRRHPAL